jgi:ATP-dependent RNA helicase SUPV3L1/SUV3
LKFPDWDAFRKYNAELDNPIFTSSQLEKAGLKPADRKLFKSHNVQKRRRKFYTSDQAVPIEGRIQKRREPQLITETDDLLAYIQTALGSEMPFVQLTEIRAKTQDILKRFRRLKARYPAPDVALRVLLNEKVAELRRLAGEYVKVSAAVINERYNTGAEITLDEGDLLSAATVKQITDELVRSFVPEHPKDEFPYTRMMERNVVIHCGETNTGKTYSALQTLMKARTGVYLAPLRLLALEIYQTLNNNGVPCDLLTGEESQEVYGARHVSSTIEKLNLDEEYDVALIDEAQMIADPHRGSSWTKAILGVRAKELIICCSNNAVPLLTRLVEDCGDTYAIERHTRNTPLVFEDKEYIFPDHVLPGDALIAFSRRRVLELADVLAGRGIETSVIYGALPPENRRMQIQRFTDGETRVVVATNAIGMGLNLPVKRIVFTQAEKFNGVEVRALTAGEIQQIAGRAGRKSMYDIGYVNTCFSRPEIERALKSRLPKLRCAYYYPVEQYVLDLPLGDLRQRLNACMSSRDIEYVQKGDLAEPLSLLADIEQYETLSMQEQYRMIFVPFDTKSGGLRALWRSYADLYSRGLPIPEPEVGGYYLDEWEHAYKILDLYYSFCNAMGLELNALQVAEKKREVAKEIDRLLLRSLRKSGDREKGDRRPPLQSKIIFAGSE